ncbi:heme-binding protein [Methylocapsa aurea]|uniref:heme-binding protein n=1 Tax=Methylocapsa aurea TaxID=663610 RepID=UPI00055D1BEF|nr:heme-binding protein [Methylocapsa aurea]
MKKALITLTLGLLCTPAFADEQACDIAAATVNKVQSQLAVVINPANYPDKNGGLFSPNRMWSAIVDRKGQLCSVINSGNDPWPGSRAIAIAKAGTANDFSNSALALSTANLYGPTQPGGSLYGLNNSNPFNPDFLGQGSLGRGRGQTPGGIITFGGGVALYQSGKVIGGLGVSGDTSCADHAIAFRMRHLAALDASIPGGVKADNISYYPTAAIDPSQFKQPHCQGAGIDVTP